MLITSPTILFPNISLSVNSLISMTSRLGSIWRSTSLFSSSVKIFLTRRPSIVLCSISCPRTNFCWWVLKGRMVFNPYSLSLICTTWVDDEIDFAIFRWRMFKPKTNSHIDTRLHSFDWLSHRFQPNKRQNARQLDRICKFYWETFPFLFSQL